jgi:TRAP-type mannitol/chloroaromatic compound transport system substrate-binding protein
MRDHRRYAYSVWAASLLRADMIFGKDNHEVAASNPRFRAVFEPWLKFREEEYLWFRVAENSFDNFVYVQSQKKT